MVSVNKSASTAARRVAKRTASNGAADTTAAPFHNHLFSPVQPGFLFEHRLSLAAQDQPAQHAPLTCSWIGGFWYVHVDRLHALHHGGIKQPPPPVKMMAKTRSEHHEQESSDQSFD